MTMMTVKCCAIVVTVAAVLFALGNNVVDARRNQGSSQRKSPSSSSSSSGSGHVTQPSYNTNGNGGSSSSNSHADVAKLSYPNYNSQPNRPIGWNPPSQGQGPPPAYSAANPAGGARTNLNEHPPSYNAPPSYGAATGSNVHQPITATQNHGTQYSGLPAGATYYPAGAPGGGGYHGGAPAGLPAGATYYPSGGYPSGGYHPAGGAPAGAPPGATYYQSPAALPPGATYYAQPPQQSSSGLGFGTGALAGLAGGAVLGHLLTPSGGSSSQPAAAAPPAAGQDRIIIINNGVPVNASADGTTVINAPGVAAAAAPGALPMNTTQDVAQPPAQLAPFNPENATMPMTANGTEGVAPPQPPAGGIICVPTKLNETDPNDSTKMIEVEKIACYPAPPPPAAPAGEGPAPLAPMVPQVQPGLQQVQQPPDQAAVKANTQSGAPRVAVFSSGGLIMMGMAILCASHILKL